MFLNQFLQNASQSPYGATGVPLTGASLAPQFGGGFGGGAQRPMNFATPGGPIPGGGPGTLPGTAGQPAASGNPTASPQAMMALLQLARGPQQPPNNVPTPQQAVQTANTPTAAGMTGMSDHGMGGGGIGNAASPGIGPQGQIAPPDLSYFQKMFGGGQNPPWTQYNPNNVMQAAGGGATPSWLSGLFGGGGGGWGGLSSLFGGGSGGGFNGMSGGYGG